MKKTRFTEEQMVTILREADRRPVPEVAKRHGVSAQTIYSWRKHVGTLEPADVKRLRQLEQENGRLKKIQLDNTCRRGQAAHWTLSCYRFRDPRRRLPWPATSHPGPAGTDQAADVAAATTGESDDAASSGRTAGRLSCDAASVVRIGLTTYNVHNLISFDTATDSR